MRTAVILTAIDVETEHVLMHLGETKQEHSGPKVFDVGRFEGGAGPWKVAVIEGRGNDTANSNAHTAIDKYKPDVVFLVGVAGGLKDVDIGDVVVATQIHGYESGKITPKGFMGRPDSYRPGKKLLGLTKALARVGNWKSRRKYPKPRDSRTVYFGPIVSGEKVVADSRSELVAHLISHFNDALALETEGRGFAAAADALDYTPWLVIRGVSDLLSGKSEADAAYGQEYAVDSAAALAFQLLHDLPTLDAPHPRGNPDTGSAPEQSNEAAPPAPPSPGDTEPTDAAERQQWWAQRLGIPDRFPLEVPGLGISLPMALIPPGEFMMGSTKKPEEFPPQTLTIRHPHAISRVTIPASLFGRWKANAPIPHADMPAVNVDWHTATAFTAWLSQATGSRIRLPSEAEWECATRAGTDTDFWCGGQALADFNIGSGNSAHVPHGRVRTVDSCTPNPWGLHHVHGNVWEWVADYYRSGLAHQSKNGAAWTGDPTDRVIKGGSCRDSSVDARSASRRARDPSRPSDILSFRVVMDLHHIGRI